MPKGTSTKSLSATINLQKSTKTLHDRSSNNLPSNYKLKTQEDTLKDEMKKLGKGQAIMLVLQDKDEEAKEEYKSKYEEDEDMDGMNREVEMCVCPKCSYEGLEKEFKSEE